MDELRIICARLPGNALVAAECQALTGGMPDAEGVAVGQTVAPIPQSAYLQIGLRGLAEAPTLEELCTQIAALSIPAEGFRIEFLRLNPASQVSKRQAILAAANALAAWPNLHTPQHRFMIVVQAQCLWFGEIITECQHTYLPHDAKPYRTSSSLPSRLARALVSMAAPTAQTILDPFCGTGSLLLEACAIGRQAYGLDWNPKMVGMTRRNLAHFGYTATVERGNALTCTRTVDAIITDLPYGRFLSLDEAELWPVLAHLVPLAPLAIYLAEQDISARLLQAGYQAVTVLSVRKRAGLSRYVHQATR
jgi:tRNA G10  N-methylase Trm11